MLIWAELELRGGKRVELRLELLYLQGGAGS